MNNTKERAMQMMPLARGWVKMVVLLWCVCAIAVGATAQTYTITDLEDLGGGYSVAQGVNDAGQVVGYSTSSTGEMHAFLYSDKGMQDLGVGQALAINNNGQVVGYLSNSDGAEHAFLYSAGLMQDLGTFDRNYSRNLDINDKGQISGYAYTSSGVDDGFNVAYGSRGFIFNNGVITDLNLVNGLDNVAGAINNNGQVVGNTGQTGGFRAFRYTNGVMEDLGTLGGARSAAWGINDSGQVVGFAQIDTGDQHAFLYNTNGMTDLGTLDGSSSTAERINNSGQIVGYSGSSAFLYSDGELKDLNTLLPPLSSWNLRVAYDINNKGQIVGYGSINGRTRAFLMSPGTVPTYTGSIIGQVTNGQVGGNPAIPKVRMELWQNGKNISTTTTDTNGNYQFTNLADGTYVLRAYDAGKLISTKTVTVQGGESSSFNFVMSPITIGSAKKATGKVVLIKGTWDLSKFDNLILALTKPIDEGGMGYTGDNILVANELVGGHASITLSAINIRNEIQEKWGIGAAPYDIDIIGHSAGGLVARDFINKYNHVGNILFGQHGRKLCNVMNLITIGAPFGGIYSLEWYPPVEPILLSMTPELVVGNKAYDRSSDVNTYVIAGLYPYDDIHATPSGAWLYAIAGLTEPLLYDGLVNIDSAQGIYPKEDYDIPCDDHFHAFWLSHGQLPQDSDVINNYIIPALYGESWDACGSGSKTLAAPHTLAAPKPLLAGTNARRLAASKNPPLTLNTMQSSSVPIAGADETTFFVATQAIGTLTLKKPDGTVITTADADASTIIYDTGAGDTLNWYSLTIKNPHDGTWTAQFTPTTVPDGGGTASLIVSTTDNLSLVGATDKTEYINGATPILTATLTENGAALTDATVSATLTKDGGGTRINVTLLDDGAHNDGAANDGVYGGSPAALTAGGVYHIDYSATGNNAESKAFQIIDSNFLTVATQNATLSQTYTDQGVDDNADSIFESLQVNVGVSVAVAGDYTVESDLQDRDGNLIGTANGTASGLPIGAGTVPVSFDGEMILKHGSAGPFTVTNVRLYDSTGDRSIWIQTDNTGYTTNAYTLAQFDHPPAVAVLQPDASNPVADASFDIILQATAGDTPATVNVYYDTDNAGNDGTLITSGLTADGEHTVTWDTSAIPKGAYYIYAVASEGIAADATSYSLGTVQVQHGSSNKAPTANDQTVTMDQDTTQAITLTGSDPEESPITYSIVDQPMYGTLSGTAPNLTYTPSPLYVGSDSFTFKVNDGSLDSNTATVSITVNAVNHAPIAASAPMTLDENSSQAIQLLASDSDNDPLSFSVVDQPLHGSLSGTGVNLTYTPTADFVGVDSFTYKANDGKVDSNIATISITVNAAGNGNHVPVAYGQSVSTDENTATSITLTGSDSDDDTLIYSVINPPTHGSLTGDTPYLTYTPTTGFAGVDSFTFKVNDGTVDSNIVTISIAVNATGIENHAPVANGRGISTNENSVKAITLTGSDDDGDTVTYSIVDSPAHGFLSGTAPNLTYTPDADYVGDDSFTFKVNDGTVDSATATINIAVVHVNHAPVANGQNVSTNGDTAKSITLTGSDSDSDALTYSVVDSPSHGTLGGTAPNLTYTPDSSYSGSDSFTFQVNDGKLNSVKVTVTITVGHTNHAPVANSQSVSTNEDTAKTITLTGSDVDSDALTYSVVDNPTHGTLSGTAPNLTYTPDSGYNGSDSFTFQANDGTVNSVKVTVTITVGHANHAPVANSQSVSTSEDIAKTITLTGSDVDSDALTYSVVDNPTHGTLSGTAPNLTYTPDSGYSGSDSFTFQVNDGTVNSVKVTVTITVGHVNHAPEANGQSVSTNEDIAKSITLTGSDVDNDALIYSVVDKPSHGTLSGAAPNLTYTPDSGYSGSDSFTFQVNDGTVDSSKVAVTITVVHVNHAPEANGQSVSTKEDIAKAITLTGSDSDSDTLTYTVVDKPSHGTLSGTAPNLTYTPDSGYSGSDSFTFQVNDGTANSNTAKINITVTAVPPTNSTPTAEDLNIATDENSSQSITLSGSDPNNSPLSYIIVTQPQHGTLSGTAPNLTYTPDAGYSGGDSFSYKVSNGSKTSGLALVSITINEVTLSNHAPVANSQSVSINVNAVQFIILNATDADGDRLTYSVVKNPGHGHVFGLGSYWLYIPDRNYRGKDSFTFKANDGKVDSNIATVDISFGLPANPVNHAPVANGQSVVTNVNTSKLISLSASDADGDALSYTVISAPAHGALTGSGANWSYTPNSNYSGGDSFTYKANDGKADSTIATVIITINNPPVAIDQSVSTNVNTPTSITLNASDADGDSVTYSLVSNPQHGFLSGTGANRTYTPNADYSGSDSFSFKANDGKADSNIATVSIMINNPPVASDQSVTMDVNTPTSITLNASDADGDAVTYSVVSNPQHGSLSGTGANRTYTPNADYSGSDSFSFKANDGKADSNIATVSITVNPVTLGNHAPVANNQRISRNGNSIQFISLSGSDVDGDALTYSVVTNPTHGRLIGFGSFWIYFPDRGYVGNDSFTFKVKDGKVDSNTATVDILAGR